MTVSGFLLLGWCCFYAEFLAALLVATFILVISYDQITSTDGLDRRYICERSCRGQPLIIKCDRGTRFTKAASSEVMKLGGTHVRFGTAHRSVSNGAVERANQAISVLLRGFRIQQCFWASLIPYVMWLMIHHAVLHSVSPIFNCG